MLSEDLLSQVTLLFLGSRWTKTHDIPRLWLRALIDVIWFVKTSRSWPSFRFSSIILMWYMPVRSCLRLFFQLTHSKATFLLINSLFGNKILAFTLLWHFTIIWHLFDACVVCQRCKTKHSSSQRNANLNNALGGPLKPTYSHLHELNLKINRWYP